jgi:hypothetical protein
MGLFWQPILRLKGFRGISFATGSLGHGLSVAAGLGLAARLKRSDKRIFALLRPPSGTDLAVIGSKMVVLFYRALFPDRPRKLVFLPVFLLCSPC